MTALANVKAHCLKCDYEGSVHVDEEDPDWAVEGFRRTAVPGSEHIVCSWCGSWDVEGIKPGAAAIVNAAQRAFDASRALLARHHASSDAGWQRAFDEGEVQRSEARYAARRGATGPRR